jgi:hypothetical protein
LTRGEIEARYAADRWPLEMAVAWIATGNKQIAAKAAVFLAEERRRGLKSPTFGNWMIAREGLSASYDTVDRALYRAEARTGRMHPIKWAMKEATRLMIGKPATGCCRGSERDPIPASAWRSASLIDDRRKGLVLHPRGGCEWREIEVPAAPFRASKFRPKRGRMPAGIGVQDLSMLREIVSEADKAMSAAPDQRTSLEDIVGDIAEVTGASEATVKRIIKKRRAASTGIEPGRRRAGRPQGQRDTH